MSGSRQAKGSGSSITPGGETLCRRCNTKFEKARLLAVPSAHECNRVALLSAGHPFELPSKERGEYYRG